MMIYYLEMLSGNFSNDAQIKNGKNGTEVREKEERNIG